MQARFVGFWAAIAVIGWIGCTSSEEDFRLCFDKSAKAEGPQLWTQLRPATSPPARYDASAIYDEANDRLVVFGGGGDNENVLGDLWVLAPATDTSGGATWTELKATGTAPRARLGHGAAYDAKNDRMIVFGGQNKTKGTADVFILTNANGLGDAPVWSALTTTNAAPNRIYFSSAYDAKSNTLVVSGGSQGKNTFVDELWLLSNANGLGTGPSTWTKVDAPSRPSPRAGAAFAVDEAGEALLSFGGASAFDETSLTVLNDTWSLLPISSASPAFSQVSAASPPGKRAFASLAYDPKSQRAILFGGRTSGSIASSTYLLSRTGAPTWASYNTGNSPPDRFRHLAAYSSKANRMVVFGGVTSGDEYLADTWVLDRANGDAPAPVTTITVRGASDVCAGNTLQVVGECADATGNLVRCPVVWTCSDPDALIAANGFVRAGRPAS